jgi:AraC-like DNA-binding protein
VWKSTPAIRRNFQELAACIEKFELGRDVTRLTLHINHLLLSLLDALREQSRNQEKHAAHSDRSVEVFFDQLKTKQAVCAKPWTLQEMAGHCGMGTTKFSRCSHALVNMSPWEYLIRCRLERAAELLRQQPEKSITETAFAYGFNSSQYFASQFRRRFHCTPKDYRKKA